MIRVRKVALNKSGRPTKLTIEMDIAAAEKLHAFTGALSQVVVDGIKQGCYTPVYELHYALAKYVDEDV